MYIVTYIPEGYSEPVEEKVNSDTGDPIVDADKIIDEFDVDGKEVIHIRWANGAGTIYHADGIDP